MGQVASSTERKAENEAVFRAANERIVAARHELTRATVKTPFFCECDDVNCREMLRIELDEYEAVRSHPTRFIITCAQRHDDPGEIVAENETYVVVEKHGDAGRVAVETDPRGGILETESRGSQDG
jgi:hypothetical protein